MGADDNTMRNNLKVQFSNYYDLSAVRGSEVCPRWPGAAKSVPVGPVTRRGGALAKPSDTSEFNGGSEVCPRWPRHPQGRSVSEAIGHIGVQ